MDESIHKLVETIHDLPVRLTLVTAGAGTQALSWLLGVPGATRTLLEAMVPYDEASFNDFLGRRPAQYVSADTAAFLAGRAFTRARQLAQDNEAVMGLACTATIITDRPKRGEHRAHIAAWNQRQVAHYTLHLAKGTRDRSGEESLVSRLLLNAVAQMAGLSARLPLSLTERDRYSEELVDLTGAARRLRAGELAYMGVLAAGRLAGKKERPPALLSGAFNPLHDGHLGLAAAAGNLLEQEVAFELSVVNVDKPPLSVDIILDRLAQFAGRWPVYASAEPTFAGKARLFPGTTFVVGYDTAVRILQPRYYQESRQGMLNALTEIAAQGCTFLVAGRKTHDGRFHEGDQLPLPKEFAHLFRFIPSYLFRRDISSTELRLMGKRGSR